MVLRRAARWARARRDELRALEKRVLLGGLAVVACLWTFLAVQGLLAAGRDDLDERVVALMSEHRDASRLEGRAWIPSLARDVTALGSGPVVILVVGIAALGLLAARRRRQALLAVAACAGGLVLGTVLKSVFDRARPDAALHATETFTSSFPSGHSLNAAVVYLTLAALVAEVERSRRLVVFSLATGIGLAVLVGVSRVYLGVHHPTDVVAGWAAGFGWATTCWLVADRLDARRRKTPAASGDAASVGPGATP